MLGMILMTQKHISQQWVKNYTTAHLKLGEPINIGCTYNVIGTVGNDS